MYGSWVRVPARSQASVKEAFFMPFIYIIYSAKLNNYYIGACIDLERRLYEHSIGHSKFTSAGTPWILKYSETFPSLQKAKHAKPR